MNAEQLFYIRFLELCFEVVSGLKVSLGKNEIFLVREVEESSNWQIFVL